MRGAGASEAPGGSAAGAAGADPEAGRGDEERLRAERREASAADGSALDPGAASLAAGKTLGGAVLARAAGPGVARVTASAGAVPETICNGQPCWDGMELSAGDPLALFAMPSTADAAPTPLFGDGLRLALESLASAGDAPLVDWEA